MKLFFDGAKLAAFFNRLNRREKIIFGVTAGVVGMLVLDQLLARPLFHTFYSLRQEKAGLEGSIKKSVRLLAQKERMMKEVAQYATFAATAKSSEEDAVALLKHIEQLANQSSVNLLYVKPAPSKAEEQIKKYYLNLECEGQMEQMLRFFYEIENSKLLLTIEKYTLQPTAKGSSVIKCASTISRALIP